MVADGATPSRENDLFLGLGSGLVALTGATVTPGQILPASSHYLFIT
jgi:hypothetical protein